MKKFACHRIYMDPDLYQSQSVIAINGRGEVVFYALLNEETNFTEWIGGIVILSPQKELHLEKEFSKFLQAAFCTESQSPLYAWHLSPFDFKNGNLMPQSILKRLQ